MQEWTESDLNWYLETLESANTKDIAGALSTIAAFDAKLQPQPIPTGNDKIVKYLEQLVEERQWCCLGMGISFIHSFAYGELRWLAARLLACEYAYASIDKPIILKDVVQPIRDHESARIDPYKTKYELFQEGLLPTKTEIIKPQDYADCCSKEAVERRLNQDKKD